MAGGFHDDVPGEVGGHGAAGTQHLAELLQFFLSGQLAEQQQVAGFFKGEAAAPAPVDEVFDIVAAVEQLAVCRTLDPVHIGKCADIRNVGQTGQHALAVFIAQAGLDAELLIQVFADLIVLGAQRLLLVKIPHHVLQIIHGLLLLSRASAPEVSPGKKLPAYRRSASGITLKFRTLSDYKMDISVSRYCL